MRVTTQLVDSAMQTEELARLLREHFSSGEVQVTEQGGHYTVSVVDAQFVGLSPVKRQQLVYAPLADLIADGRIHAVNIKTSTPQH